MKRRWACGRCGATPQMRSPSFTWATGVTPHQLELTWLADRAEAYDLGENEFHLAFTVDDYAAAHALHKEMGCICFENEAMGIYFISDPDGYWIEIVPEK